VISSGKIIEPISAEQSLASLMKSIADGDQTALAALYDKSSRLLYGLIMRVLGETTSAEEVLLDVYKLVWDKAHTFDESRGNALAWMTTIARRRAIDRLRAIKPELQFAVPVEEIEDRASDLESPEEAAFISERRKLVRKALDSLPLDQREAIEMAFYSGLSHSQIALRLRQPLGTVKTRIRLAMIKLRDALNPAAEGWR
jgi:RNA polymerase sigma-70 factor (ECF subfamily)